MARYLSAALKVAANQNIKDRDYWINRLAGEIEKSYFPCDREPAGPRGVCFAEISFRIPGEITSRLLELTRGSDYALHIYLAAGVVLLLYHYTGKEDILVASPIYKQDMEGEFINRVILLRNRLKGKMTVKELLMEVRQTVTEAVEHQNYPLEMLPEQLNLANDDEGDNFPLFDTSILLENLHEKEYLAQINHNMRFSFSRNNNTLMGNIEYNSQLYEKSTTEKISDRFIVLMKQALDNLDSCIARLEVLPGEERRKNIKWLNKKKEKGGLIPPRGSIQEKLVEIWSEILKVEKELIGIDTNFFKLGGHSLKASRLMMRIHQDFDVRIPLTVVFAAPFIRALAREIAAAKEKSLTGELETGKYAALGTVEKKEYYPLSSAQVRLFILEQQGDLGTTYNMLNAIKLKGHLQAEVLEKAFRRLVHRYESLRTSFHWINGEPVQRVIIKPVFKVESYDISQSRNKKGQKDLEPVLKDFLRPFKLDRAPLFRVGLVKLQASGNEHILLVDMHHIISDGISMGILVREFAGLYKGEELQQLHTQYKDFTQWEHQFFETPAFNQQEKFWKENLNGQLPRLPMPIDFNRPKKQTFTGSEITFTISPLEMEQLIILAEEKNVTLNILLLSIYFLLLYKYTNQEDIIVGSLVSGRNHPDLAHMIGMFGNFLPIRNRIEPGHSFSRFLAASRERIAAVYGNQDYPFEKIIDLLEVPIDGSRNPVFDTMLIFHNELELSFQLDISGLDISAYPLARTTSKLDFKLDVFPGTEAGGNLRFSLEYNTDLFKKQTMQRLIGHFKRLIHMVTTHPERKISEIEIFSAKEKQDLSGKRKLNTLKTVTQKKPVQLVVSATFTPGPIEEYILWWGKQFGLAIEIAIAPYNQVFQQLLEEKSLLSANVGSDSRGINLLLIRFEDWIRDLDLDDESKCAKLEKDFLELVRIIRHKEISSPYLVGLFPVSTHLSLSARLVNYLEDLDRRWKKLVEETANFYLLDFTSLAQRYQIGEVFDPVMDKEGHLPFTHEYYAAVGTQTARTISALVNSPFKIIVLDADNTLWQGICGEDGPLGVNVAPPYLELQRLMLQKHDQGMLLTLCSKNNPTDVWDVFEKNPGMLLTRNHFVDWKINWQPKSQNIKELAAQLNLGVDSFIFIDDSAVECTEVITNCPDVLTLRLPADPERIPLFLEHIWALDKMMVTPEDKMRTSMYRADKKRKEIREQAPSLTEFLSQLQLKVSFNIMNTTQVDRVSQLTRRTNQFNLSTRRRREDEIMVLAETPGTCCWVLEVSDRFGDYGLVGVVITIERSDHLFLDTFLLSCRVLGRGVEDAILTCLKKYLQESDFPGIKADYYPTPKNKPILEFLQRTWKLEEQVGNYTTYSLKEEAIRSTPVSAEIYYRRALPKPVQQHREGDNHREISLDHIAVAVVDMEQARSYYRTIGYTCGEVITDQRQNVRLSMCRQPGYDSLELVSVIDRQSPTAVLVEQNRDIPYHLCYRVRDIPQTLTALREQEIPFEVVNNSKPAVLFDNKNVIFIQVGQVGLVEFLEDKDRETGVTDEQTNRHNTLRIVLVEPRPAVKFYRYLGYTTVAKHEDNDKLIITMSKPGAGHIELTIPGERPGEEQQFLQQNGPHPFRLVFYGSFPGQETEGFAPYPYTLFKPREQEPGSEKQKKSAPGPALDMEVYGLDREDWLHRPHLLPLQYCTAGKLLQLPTYQVEKTRFSMGKYDEPQDELQRRLEQVWRDLLKLEKIGINTSFFAAGGNSLKAIIMVSKLGKELNVQLTLKEVFDHPTIKKLAKYITGHAEKTGFLSIEPVEKKEYYKLSSAQKRLYILQVMEVQSIGYNFPSAVLLEGNIEIQSLENAIQRLIKKHEALRTSFAVVNSESVQRIHDRVDFKLEVDDQGKKHMQQFLRPFDLSLPPLIRVGLIREGREKHILMVDIHHIVYDGTSMAIFFKELMSLYGGKELLPLRIQYKDYAQWRNSHPMLTEKENQEAYWLNVFTGEIPVINLPLDFARPPFQDFKGHRLGFVLDENRANSLNNIAKEEGVTLYMVLLAMINVLLMKLSSQEDIVVGTPLAGRKHPDLEQIIGIFINTLALRNYPTNDKTFREFLVEIKERTLNAFENQDYPFEELVEKVKVKRDVSRNPIFDVMFRLHNFEAPGGDIRETEIRGLKLSPYHFDPNTSIFDLNFGCGESGDKLVFTIDYCTALFKVETIERMIKYFREMVEAVQEKRNLAKKLAEIEIISRQEKFRLLHDFNRTKTGYPKDKTIHKLFEEQAARTPDHVALVGLHQTHEIHYHMSYMSHMSYQELNQKSNQLAHLLQEKGVKPGTIAAILVNRTLLMMVGLMGILKTGAAYLPLDPEYPEKRIKYILANSNVGVLVTTPQLQVKVKAEVEGNVKQPGFHLQFIHIHTDPVFPVEPSFSTLTSTLTCRVSLANPAYVIYTSGSTGNPKGVVIRHQNAVNFIRGMTAVIDFSPAKAILALTTISFDIFFLETLLPLTRGLKVVIAGEDQQKDPALLEQLIVNSQVNMVQFTPSRLQLLLKLRGNLQGLAGAAELMVGGEAFPSPLLEAVKEHFPGKIYNMYGPTETTIWSAVKELTQALAGEITIGTPIANTRVYIVDKHNWIQPLGVPGELLIGGDGVASGYLNNPELTGEKFILNRHYRSNKSYKSYILYRTGDLARWLSNGEIEFLGRIDHQVKIRGYRVELEEIEEQLLKHEHLKEAVVVVKPNPGGEKSLCAYLLPNTTASTSPPNSADLREMLANKLPAYMIPSYFVMLEKMPLTPNGKIDRKALPEPKLSRSHPEAGGTFVKPATDNEKIIARIWKELLPVEELGINENFFDLGGNSMNVIQLNWKLKETFGIDIPVALLFRNLTIDFLSKYLGQEEIKSKIREKHIEALDRGQDTLMDTVSKLIVE